MKKAMALFVLLLIAAISPAFAFIHPEIPCAPTMGIVINDTLAKDWEHSYNFTEPDDHWCSTFTVEVWVFGVTDLYAYEFALGWWASPVIPFELVAYEVNHIHAADFVLLPDEDYAESGPPYPQPYKQVVTAVSPAVGVSGDFKLATLTFHFTHDVTWAEDDKYGEFYFEYIKLSDSCSQEIPTCNTINAYWRFKPVQPRIYLEPTEETNWVVGDTFTVSVWVENIVKMKSLHFNLTWANYELLYYDYSDGKWKSYSTPVYRRLLKVKSITVNSEVFGTKYDRDKNIVGSWNAADNSSSGISFYIQMKCYWPLINGTFKVMDIVFEKLDPWYCGYQPPYELTPPHNWDAVEACTSFEFVDGWFDVYDNLDQKVYIYFATCYGDVRTNAQRTTYRGYAVVGEWVYLGPAFGWVNILFDYCFDPIPGDLDGSGHVDIVDLMAIAYWYGAPVWTGSKSSYYDLNKDGVIDIFDIVIVAKNFCRTEP